MKIGFVGTVKGSLAAWNALVSAGRTPAVCITLPPSLSHRHSDYADLAPAATSAGAQVIEVDNVNDAAVISAIEAAELDLCLVIGWSQICRAPFRNTARLGMIGYHPAPLPRFRGRAVIPWTILAGERRTASTLFWLDEGVDSGPIIAQQEFEVTEDETATSLYAKHNAALCEMLPGAVDAVEKGEGAGWHQDEAQASYCAKRVPGDGLIDWREPASEVHRLVRAVASPYPGAFTFTKSDRIVIDAARPFAQSSRYIGLPGQVQAHSEDGFVVRCGDGECLEIVAWRGCEGAPRLHSRLNGAGQ